MLVWLLQGMPHKYYHGKTGRVWNVTKRAVGVEMLKQVGGLEGGPGSRLLNVCVLRPLLRACAACWACSRPGEYRAGERSGSGGQAC